MKEQNKLNTEFATLTEEQLQEIDGGIAPFLIGAGIVAGLGGGFAIGYGLALKFG